LGLLVLSLGGVAWGDLTSHEGLRFWSIMAPVFAGVSLYSGWSRARRQGVPASQILTRQILHWLVLAGAMALIALLQRMGRLDDPGAGLMVLLSLSVTAVLAGVHFDWLFGVLGLVLALAVLVVALFEKFVWVFVVLTAVLGALVVVILWRRRAA